MAGWLFQYGNAVGVHKKSAGVAGNSGYNKHAGADVHFRGSDGFTPLMFAAYSNENVEVIHALLAAEADPDAVIRDGTSVLMLVAMNNTNPEVLRILVDAGADPTKTTRNGSTEVRALESNAVLANNPSCRMYLGF